jgi:hypothetical protein
MFAEISRQFAIAGDYNGGFARGINWVAFKRWYHRITDNRDVEYYGGVPRINGRGLVRGKLRLKRKGSKRRFTPRDRLMEATGEMKNGVVSRMIVTEKEIKLSPDKVYTSHQNSRREFFTFTDKDQKAIGIIALNRYKRAMQQIINGR